MSWIDKEMKRRAAAARADTRAHADSVVEGAQDPPETAAARVHELWQRLARANEALPPELRLRVEQPEPPPYDGVGPWFSAWLRAPNGAGLGLTAEAIRYAWPGRSKGRSHNFWIRWQPRRGWRIRQRIGKGPSGPRMADYAFDETALDSMIQRLVTGTRVKVRSVRRKRFWIF